MRRRINGLQGGGALASREEVLQQLDRLLASRAFGGASRSQALLRYLVEHALDGRADHLKEYTLGSEALGRGEAFDPRTDPIVRAEASRLRNRLERHYSTEGAADQVIISLPKGNYMPQFEERREDGAAPVDTRRLAWIRAPRTWIATAAILATGVFATVRWSSGDRGAVTSAADPVLFDVELSRGDATLGADVGNDVALSPDGTRVVFVARGTDGQLRLLAKSFRPTASGAPDAVELPGTTGARSPFFSPDGLWVGFWANGMLKKTAVDRGSPVELTEAGDFGGGRWDATGIIAGLGQSIVRIQPDGGAPSVLLDLSDEGIYPRWPDILPGGRHIAFTALGIAARPSIVALSLADGSRQTLVPDGSFARYVPGDHLAYVHQGSLWTVPIDPRSVTVSGTAVPVIEGIAHAPNFGVAQFDISRNGTLLFRRSHGDGQLVVAWVNRDGSRQPIVDTPGAYTFPRLSPDGRRLAFASTKDGRTSITQHEMQGGRLTPTPVASGTVSPVWTPDGRFLVVGTLQGLQWIDPDEPTAPKPLTAANVIQVPWSFSPDGRLAYAEMNATTGFDLWTVPVTITGRTMSAGTPKPYLATPAHETYPSISPDGAWMAYGSGRYSTWEVYVRPFPSAGGREIQVSQGGGRIARWLPGRQILYRTDDHRLMVVTYDIRNGNLVPGTPRAWTPARLADTLVFANFDVDGAGQRVAGLLPPPGSDAGQPSRNHATVIVNFPEELRRLRP